MAFAGGSPSTLATGSRNLSTLSSDLAGDAATALAQGKAAAAAAGGGMVSEAAELAMAAVSGALVASSTIVRALSDATDTAGEQLTIVTGGPR
ncbi:hypothetical protein [Ornithinimicrobium flavum]|uniref:hypothetical protein n=1 Tax=Ornithinimicrobium flavum TaxID=1288636 RepID=UPI00106F7C07|nr:hypothetical protein [Ornithinimicrobium flavum]